MGEKSVNRFDSSISLSGFFSGEHKKPTIILLLAPLIITTWKYFGTKQFYLSKLTDTFIWFNNPELTAEYYTFLCAFVLMGIVPLAVVKFVFDEPWRNYGLQIGDWKFGWKAFAVMAPVMILSTIPSAKMPEFVAEYPLYKGAGLSAMKFFNHASSYLLFYIGWEIFFRGFVQFGLRPSMGEWNAILVQAALSCIAHIGKPTGEIYISILGALVWGVVTFRSRSILYVLLVHWLLGVSLDYFICFW